MGKFYNGILGTMTGKVGGVVGRTWKGINTVSAYQPNVSNPRTNAQIGQRDKLTVLTKLASNLNSGYIKPLWDKDSKKMSGFNAWIQANMPFVDANGDIDFHSLIMSKGKMTASPISGVSVEADNVSIEFLNSIGDAFQLPSDLAFVAVVAANKEEVFLSSGLARRSEGVVTVSIPRSKQANLHYYLSFRRADGSLISDSSYMNV